MKIDIDIKIDSSTSIGYESFVDPDTPDDPDDPFPPHKNSILRITEEVMGADEPKVIVLSGTSVQDLIDAVVAIKTAIDSLR